MDLLSALPVPLRNILQDDLAEAPPPRTYINRPGPETAAPGGLHHYVPHYEDYYDDQTRYEKFSRHPTTQMIASGAANAVLLLHKLALAGTIGAVGLHSIRGIKAAAITQQAAWKEEADRLAGTMVPVGPGAGPPPTGPGSTSGYHTPAGEWSTPPSPREGHVNLSKELAVATRRSQRRTKTKQPSTVSVLAPATRRRLKYEHAMLEGVVIPRGKNAYKGYITPDVNTVRTVNYWVDRGMTYLINNSREDTIEHLATLRDDAGEPPPTYVLDLFTVPGVKAALSHGTYIPDALKPIIPGNVDRIHAIGALASKRYIRS